MTAKFVPAIDFGECVSSPHPPPPKKAAGVEIEAEEAIDFGECLSIPQPPPPKKARVEIQAEEACDEFTKSEAIDFVECLPPIKSRAEIEADEFEEACVKFFEEISISDGFDIETFPDPSRILCGGMVKVVFDLEHLCSQVHRDWSLPFLDAFSPSTMQFPKRTKHRKRN
ncbi:unnamed protein product [Cuscuta campestris]|uniref:Uncharacterized protein n=1 Tax=Cuscuta campestris TaxID=132261 RepID=A0A484NTC5_9ASTE|nr:unnamed protein product [Cuscuta campestris]